MPERSPLIPDPPAFELSVEEDQLVRKAERERCDAIINGEAAQGRSALAKHFALDTDFTPAEALAMLNMAPIDRAELGEAMAPLNEPRELRIMREFLASTTAKEPH